MGSLFREGGLYKTDAKVIGSVEPPPYNVDRVLFEVVYVNTPSRFWVNYVEKQNDLASVAEAIEVNHTNLFENRPSG